MTDQLPTFYSPWPVLGYRMWHTDGGALGGVFGWVWDSPAHEASCSIAESLPKVGVSVPDDWLLTPAPHYNAYCVSCGVYAYKTLDDLKSNVILHSDFAPVGLVAMTGVIEHAYGYRARRVLVLAMRKFPGWQTVRRQWRRRGHKVEFVNSEKALEEIAARFEAHPQELTELFANQKFRPFKREYERSFRRFVFMAGWRIWPVLTVLALNVATIVFHPHGTVKAVMTGAIWGSVAYIWFQSGVSFWRARRDKKAAV